jgi:hypothetical protein
MESGAFRTVDELLIVALKSSRSNVPGDELHRRRLFEWLEQAGPGWDPERHPELAEGAAHWVDGLRRSDEEIDSATASR